MKRKIVSVIVDGQNNSKVILDDGSELDGITFLEAEASVNSPSSILLRAYIYPATCYEHQVTKKRVYLNKEQEERFFDNNSPAFWKKI